MIRCASKVNALDARRDAVIVKPVDDSKVDRQIVTARGFYYVCPRRWSKVPHVIWIAQNRSCARNTPWRAYWSTASQHEGKLQADANVEFSLLELSGRVAGEFNEFVEHALTVFRA